MKQQRVFAFRILTKQINECESVGLCFILCCVASYLLRARLLSNVNATMFSFLNFDDENDVNRGLVDRKVTAHLFRVLFLYLFFFLLTFFSPNVCFSSSSSFHHTFKPRCPFQFYQRYKFLPVTTALGFVFRLYHHCSRFRTPITVFHFVFSRTSAFYCYVLKGTAGRMTFCEPRTQQLHSRRQVRLSQRYVNDVAASCMRPNATRVIKGCRVTSPNAHPFAALSVTNVHVDVCCFCHQS